MIKKDGKEYYTLEETSNILDEKIKIRAKKVVSKIFDGITEQHKLLIKS